MFQPMIRFGLIVSLAVLTLTCLDQIDLAQGAALEDGIALSGRMWVQDSQASVTFRGGRLFRFTSNRSERLINADVSVELSNGTSHSLNYDLERNVFEASFDLPAAEQDSLQARIRVISNEGDDYLSNWDPLPERFVPDTLIPRQIFDDDGAPVSITYELETPARRTDGSGVPFLYRLSQSYRVRSPFPPVSFCYFYDSIRQTRLTLVDPSANYSGDLRTVRVYTDAVDWRYAEGHYFNVTQDPLSDAAYDYFRKFQNFVDRDRSVFEAPPGDLTGNFRSLTDPEQARIYGLFYVTRPQVIRAGIPEGAVEVEAFCIPVANFNNNRCRDCVRAGGSQLRPDYWTF